MSLVFAGVCSHAPGITARAELADPDVRDGFYAALEALREQLERVRPDALVVIAAEHFANFFMDNMPSFAVGMADFYDGPIEDPAWLRIGRVRVPGDRDLAKRLIEEIMRTSDIAYAEEWRLDHGIMVPLHFLTPRYDVPLVPMNINCQGPPLTPLHRAWAFGEAVRRAADAVPERLAVLGTGGISHWPATPDSGRINESWDRDFLARWCRNERDELVGYDDRSVYAEAGQGGFEIRTFVAVSAAAAGAPGTVHFYAPIPIFAVGCTVATYAIASTASIRHPDVSAVVGNVPRGDRRERSGGFDVTTTTDGVVFPAPDEIEGFWALDKMHAPRPITPLSFDLIVHTLAEGFTKAQAEYDCPIMVSTREINHFFYVSFHPIPDEGEIARRMVSYHEKLAEKVPTIGRTWEEEWKQDVIAKNVPLKTADWSTLSDAELIAKLDELTQWIRDQWWIHGHVNFVLLSSSAFCDLYDKVVQPDEPTEAYRMLQGFPTTSVDAAHCLWALSRTALATPAVKELFDTKEGSDLLAGLDDSEEGRDFRRQLDEFLFEFGWRHDAVYDLADVPWREDPAIPLSSIRALMELPDSEDPEAQYRRNVAAREELFASLRERLADDPATMTKLDELYEAARYSFPLTEDHAFYIDQMYISVFRRFVLAVGDRLVTKGVFDQPDDVFYLYRDELVDVLTNGGDRRANVAERRASFERASKVSAPTELGTPPAPPDVPDPFMDALVSRLLGMVPPEENADPGVLKAVAGSPGVYTGPARVCRSLAQATDDLEEGEVMVVEMTLPPWVPLFSLAGAVVSDVGGILSHSAIVARECGVPAVVGTNVGTVVIKTGQTITVDGNKGVVYLDGRSV